LAHAEVFIEFFFHCVNWTTVFYRAKSIWQGCDFFLAWNPCLFISFVRVNQLTTRSEI
jgi:hypothetical protein